jgi:hypothetical protein
MLEMSLRSLQELFAARQPEPNPALLPYETGMATRTFLSLVSWRQLSGYARLEKQPAPLPALLLKCLQIHRANDY